MTDTAPISTPFTAESTASEVIAGIDLGGRRAVVTGGASGIGAETARTLAGAGAQVTLAVRDTGSRPGVAYLAHLIGFTLGFLFAWARFGRESPGRGAASIEGGGGSPAG